MILIMTMIVMTMMNEKYHLQTTDIKGKVHIYMDVFRIRKKKV